MTEKLDRRAILAGTAVLPVLAVPAAARGGPDPIFEKIKAHRRKLDALYLVLHDSSEAEARWLKETDTLTPSLLICTRAQFESEGHLPWPFGGRNELRLHSAKGIDQLFVGPEYLDSRKTARAKLAAIKRKYRAIFQPIEARVRAAHEAEKASRLELAKTAPATVAGILAMLRYAREQDERCSDDFFDGEERDEFHASLERAVTKVAA